MGFDATIFSGMLEAIQARNFWFGCYFYYWLKWHWCAFACVVIKQLQLEILPSSVLSGLSPSNLSTIRSMIIAIAAAENHFPTTTIYFPIFTSYTSFNRSIKFHVDCRYMSYAIKSIFQSFILHHIYQFCSIVYVHYIQYMYIYLYKCFPHKLTYPPFNPIKHIKYV